MPSSNDLSARDLKALDAYKYSGKDFSLCSKYFMQAYWTAVVELVPKSVAPNMLTTTGFLCAISTSVILFWLSLTEPTAVEFPRWVWAYAGVALFAYQTLDAIDGKQARRTGSGSPLGELFDHGCDALFTPLVCTTTALAIGLTPIETFVYCFWVSTGMFLALFEQFSTGTLDLGYINGPVEGILLSSASLIYTSFVGPLWWSSPFAAPLLDLGVSVFGVRLAVVKPNDVLLAIAIIAGTCTGVVNLAHAFTQPVANENVNRLMTLLPQTLIAGLTFGLAMHAPQMLRTGPFKFAVELSYGWLVSYTVTRMTVARLCSRAYKPTSIPFGVMLFILLTTHGYLFAMDYLGKRANGLILDMPFAISAIVTVACYVWMIFRVFNQIARHLRINIFTLTAEQKAKIAQQPRAAQK